MARRYLLDTNILSDLIRHTQLTAACTHNITWQPDVMHVVVDLSTKTGVNTSLRKYPRPVAMASLINPCWQTTANSERLSLQMDFHTCTEVA
jgi:hypothetical protein